MGNVLVAQINLFFGREFHVLPSHCQPGSSITPLNFHCKSVLMSMSMSIVDWSMPLARGAVHVDRNWSMPLAHVDVWLEAHVADDV
jgi:hypothetical protein